MRRLRIPFLAASAAVLAAVIVPVVTAATPPNRALPGQRIDVKVLLISADGTEPGFGAWKAELDARGRAVRHVRRLQRPDEGRRR